MVRPFQIRDSLKLLRLQQTGAPLDIEEQLTQPCPPLRLVLLEKLFSPRAHPSTFLLDQPTERDHILGLAQVRTRPGQVERDVVFMSPRLDVGSGGYAIWQRLLTHISINTAEHGGLRVFARLPNDSNELHLFKSVGFVEYSQEEIFCRQPTQVPLPADGGSLPLRSQKSSDSWALQRLYTTLTPHPVQNVEGLGQGRWALPHQMWGEPGQRRGYVWEKGGELLGVVHLRVGKHGCWVRTLVHPDAFDQVENLGRTALALLKPPVYLPIYFSMRQYEAGWLNVLPRLGFEALTSQNLLVKNMAVQARKTISTGLPVLKDSQAVGSQTSAVSQQSSGIQTD
ncbi:hypothetical protein QUF64_04140 [Anaerolineales bacterium HSG6]|nr:hypothetical protein [Anaerolineales bacterium HSG6]MDM8532039.1 hypothetical protein [Anaerolineales bacterium HSG25]